MIEKITNQNQIARNKLAEKINQLVDAVNELQAKCAILQEHAHPTAKVDPYAEQRKWIGKLCWFWNNDNEPDTCFGVLTGLFDEADRPFERSIGQQLYRYCEPVKPDDDIIYKGGDNE